jgi:hypothetical protein
MQNNWVSLLLITQFIYNAMPQEGMGMSPFKVNYNYELKISLLPKQVKKSSETAKERVKTLINLYKNL